MFQRLYFLEAFERELENGSKVAYLARHFYHVEEDVAKSLIDSFVAEEESAREARLKREADLAAEEEARKKLKDNPVTSSTGAVGAPAGNAEAANRTQPPTPAE